LKAVAIAIQRVHEFHILLPYNGVAIVGACR
jgi:hypothetical protein